MNRLFGASFLSNAIDQGIVCAITSVVVFAAPIAGVLAETRPDISDAQVDEIHEIKVESPLSQPARRMRYFIGDQLKIAIYENFSARASTAGAATSKSVNLVERSELTGVYTVQSDGRVYLPLLGPVEADGEDEETVQKSIENAFESVFANKARASVLLADREPVYFVGKGGAATTLKYTSAMTVMHAVAGAGATQEGREDAYTRSERLREREREKKAIAKLKPALARLAVLRAEVAGDDNPKADERLLALVGPKAADAAIEQERKREQIILESKRVVLDSYSSAIAIATQRHKNQLAKLEFAEKAVETRAERSRLVESLKSRGNASNSLVAQVSGDLADVNLRRGDVMNEVSSSEVEIRQAEKERARYLAENKASLLQEIRVLEDEVSEGEATLAGSRVLISELTAGMIERDTNEGNIAVKIVRRTQNSTVEILGNAMTPLQPGDLVQIVSQMAAISGGVNKVVRSESSVGPSRATP